MKLPPSWMNLLVNRVIRGYVNEMSPDRDAGLSRTHPFLNFADFYPDSLTFKTWLLLGETMSKCQHLAGAPITPRLAEHLERVYLARGAQATTAIEGNTLELSQVEQIVDRGSAGLGPSRAYQEQEVANIVRAVRDMRAAITQGHHLPITVTRLCELNAMVLHDVPVKPHVVPGELRRTDVTVGPYRPPDYREIPALVKEFEDWLRRTRQAAAAQAADHPDLAFALAVITAILAHLNLAWIHPFGDGNGRLARLIEVQILSESGVPSVATQLLANHFNLTRELYYFHLDQARSQRGVANFIHYAVQGLADGLREQITLVQEQNLHIVWQSYMHELFEKKYTQTPARARQRKLATALPAAPGDAVTPEQATELTPALTRLYAAAGDRMPARDLNDLVKLDLAVRVGPPAARRFRARRELVQAFLPPAASIVEPSTESTLTQDAPDDEPQLPFD